MLRPLINVPACLPLVLVAIATQWSVVCAQSQGNNPYYYWFSPGRIVGIAIGVLALILLILSMLILACRRRRHAKATSRVTASDFSRQPQQFPSWQGQQPIQTPYGPGVGWHYPAHGTAPFERVKSTEFGQAQRTAPFEEVRGTPSSSQVQRPPPTTQVQSTTPPRPEQRFAPEGRTQSAAPSVRAQYQAAPIPPPARRAPGGTPSAGVATNRDQSPPPYYPPTPPTPPPAHTTR